MDHHFSYKSIFGPIICEYFDDAYMLIIMDYCGYSTMDPSAYRACIEYCVQNDEYDALMHFVDRVDPEIIFQEAAREHKPAFVALALERGAKNWNLALPYAIAPGNLEWMIFFKDAQPGGWFCPNSCIVIAMRYGHTDLMRTIWSWDIDRVIDRNYLVSKLSASVNPIAVLTVLDDFGVIDYTGYIDITDWDHATQIRMMYLLKDRGYNPVLFACVAGSGNAQALCLAKKWGAQAYREMFRLAVTHRHTHIMRIVRNWYAIDYDEYLKSMIETFTADDLPVADLLISWGAKLDTALVQATIDKNNGIRAQNMWNMHMVPLNLEWKPYLLTEPLRDLLELTGDIAPDYSVIDYHTFQTKWLVKPDMKCEIKGLGLVCGTAKIYLPDRQLTYFELWRYIDMLYSISKTPNRYIEIHETNGYITVQFSADPVDLA